MTLLRRPIFLLILAWHVAIALLSIVAPHPPLQQHRSFPYAPPTPVRIMHNGALAAPFVYGLKPHPELYGVYMEDRSARYSLHLLARRSDGGTALLAADAPGLLFLLGTDEFGRDLFSRVLAGGLLSIGCGVAATLLTLLLAAVAGGLGGMAGGAGAWVFHRATELLMALPVLYLLLALRAALPIDTEPVAAFAIAVLMIATLGWARPARLVRGVLLSARERGFVLAARGFGAGPVYLLRHHLLPQTLPVLGAQAAILLPQFVLLEVTLSFLGLGVPEPVPSWGSMLSALRELPVIASYYWVLAPGAALTISLLLFGSLAALLDEDRDQQTL